MTLTVYTNIHVLISLVGILAGFVVLYGLLISSRMEGWTKLFLGFTVATSLTGFGFPIHGVTPAIVVGIISLILLALAIYGRYGRRLAGGWRKTYVITALLAQYLNVFVLIVQSFQKVPALHSLAPTQSETPFKLVQGVVLVLFIAGIIAATIRFRDEPVRSQDCR